MLAPLSPPPPSPDSPSLQTSKRPQRRPPPPLRVPGDGPGRVLREARLDVPGPLLPSGRARQGLRAPAQGRGGAPRVPPGGRVEDGGTPGAGRRRALRDGREHRAGPGARRADREPRRQDRRPAVAGGPVPADGRGAPQEDVVEQREDVGRCGGVAGVPRAGHFLVGVLLWWGQLLQEEAAVKKSVFFLRVFSSRSLFPRERECFFIFFCKHEVF